MNDSEFEDEYQPDWSEGEDMEQVKSKGEGITVEINSYAMERIETAAAAGVRQQLAARIDAIIQEEIATIVETKLAEAVGAMAEKAILEYLTRPRPKTNSWGEQIGGGTMTLSEMIPQKVEGYLNESVKSDGTPVRDHYDRKGSETRLDWIVNKSVRDELNIATKKAAADVTEKAKQVVAAHVGRFVAEQMIPQIEINGRA